MPYRHRPFKRLGLWGIFCLFFLLMTNPAVAQMRADHIINKVERQTGGRVIAVTATKEKHRYNVRVLMPNGRVKTVVVEDQKKLIKGKGMRPDARLNR